MFVQMPNVLPDYHINCCRCACSKARTMTLLVTTSGTGCQSSRTCPQRIYTNLGELLCVCALQLQKTVWLYLLPICVSCAWNDLPLFAVP
jgi:hypothetical protein